MFTVKILKVGVILALCGVGLATVQAQEHWPEFRGPLGNGSAVDVSQGPENWSETEHVSWKTAIPHMGWSSPAILGDQIWITTATEDGSDYYVIQLNAETGKIKRNKKLFHSDDPEPLGNAVNCYASPSPVLEEGRVYIHFGSYGTACLDTDTGKVLWKRDDLECRHFRGPGSSPILFEDLLILSFDGIDQQYLTALDKNTGKTVWRTDRTTVFDDLDERGRPKNLGDYRKAFSTPLIVESGGKPLMISPGSFSVFGYDPRTGKEIWNVRHGSHTARVRPVFADGIVYVTAGGGPTELLAIRVDGEGDVTDSHVVWRKSDGAVPTTPSLLLIDSLLYLGTDRGIVTCLDAADGEEVWTERIGGNYVASPLHAGDNLYFFSTQGKTTVMKAGRNPKIGGTNELDAGCMASPAMLGSSLILRSKTHLYRIETN